MAKKSSRDLLVTVAIAAVTVVVLNKSGVLKKVGA